jgi:thioester reductase-like protein
MIAAMALMPTLASPLSLRPEYLLTLRSTLMNQATIVTGATDFLGSHLVARILNADADVTVICLSCPSTGRTAHERVLQAVGRAYLDRNEHDEPSRWADRVVVIEHDLGENDLRPEGVADVASRVFQINGR